MNIVYLDEYRKKQQNSNTDPPKKNGQKDAIDYSKMDPVSKISVGKFYYSPILNISVQAIAFVENSIISKPFVIFETTAYDIIPIDLEDLKPMPMYEITVEDYTRELS